MTLLNSENNFLLPRIKLLRTATGLHFINLFPVLQKLIIIILKCEIKLLEREKWLSELNLGRYSSGLITILFEWYDLKILLYTELARIVC